MRINCLHGYFIFEELKAGDISRFMSLFGLSIVRVGQIYTFESLAEAPDFSVIETPYLGVAATSTIEGPPWEVMRANELVYDFNADVVKRITTVTSLATLVQTANYFLSPGLIQPGSVTEDGSRVTDYAAWFLFDSMKFKYSEVTFV